jgi:hypothetical protein
MRCQTLKLRSRLSLLRKVHDEFITRGRGHGGAEPHTDLADNGHAVRYTQRRGREIGLKWGVITCRQILWSDNYEGPPEM